MADTYLLVHGAWHTGALMEPTAQHLRELGCTVHCPTLAGNRPGDDRAAIGLQDAARSLVEFIESEDLTDIRLVGHSYGGMVISQAAMVLKPRLRRLVYVNAFVPLNGQCLSYLNFLQDTSMPHSMPWHPRLSERLGLFRLVESFGSHETWFTNPKLTADKIVEAGRD
jgi:pimeloyl-ACP methyl ester carboxylesterase